MPACRVRTPAPALTSGKLRATLLTQLRSIGTNIVRKIAGSSFLLV